MRQEAHADEMWSVPCLNLSMATEIIYKINYVGKTKCSKWIWNPRFIQHPKDALLLWWSHLCILPYAIVDQPNPSEWIIWYICWNASNQKLVKLSNTFCIQGNCHTCQYVPVRRLCSEKLLGIYCLADSLLAELYSSCLWHDVFFLNRLFAL